MEKEKDEKKPAAKQDDEEGCCGGCCGDGDGCCGGSCDEDGPCCEDEDEKDATSKKKEEEDKSPTELADEYLNGWKRCQADFENYKQSRMNMQRDLAALAEEDFVVRILPVLDNFHASTDHVPQDQKDNAWVQGIMFIRQQLESTLREMGVEALGVKDGDPFDPTIHEAIESGSAESEEKDAADGTVAKVLQQGYRFRGKTIRPARVAVKL